MFAPNRSGFRALSLVLPIAVAMAMTGCNKDAGAITVHGAVTLDGAPLANRLIHFKPASDSGPSESRRIEDGAYGLTRWSIRAALTVLVLCCAGRQLASDNQRWQAIDRLLWPLGCALFLTHIAAAIYFFHHGSQTAAFADIANQIKEVLGAAVGEGLYVNYLMAVVWTADAVWLAALPHS